MRITEQVEGWYYSQKGLFFKEFFLRAPQLSPYQHTYYSSTLSYRAISMDSF